jgi:hypothetical protein
MEHRLTSGLPLNECRARLARLPATPPGSGASRPVVCGRVRGTSFRLYAEAPNGRRMRRYFYGALSPAPEGTRIAGEFRRSALARLLIWLYAGFLLAYGTSLLLPAVALARQQLGELLICGTLIAGVTFWVRLKRAREDERMLAFLESELDARRTASASARAASRMRA